MANKNVVNTNTSWKGGYLDVDLNTDYKALQNQAEARGDYAQAANFEALRNAKINYLNSTNANKGSYQTTDKYIGANKNTNNKGGTAYTAKNNDINYLNAAPPGTHNIGGITYKKDSNGSLSIHSGNNTATGEPMYSPLGNSVNRQTGEFMFTNPEDAKKEYLRQMLMSGAVKPNTTYNQLEAAGLVDPNYLDALSKGTVGVYNNGVIAAAKKKQEEAMKNTAIAGGTLMDDARDQVNNTTITDSLNENSFETDVNDVNWDDYYGGLSHNGYTRY